jgi:acetoin utilization protein AcuC
LLYSFPGGHPLSNKRTELFGPALSNFATSRNNANPSIVQAALSNQKEVELFHTSQYVDFVRRSSETGSGFLDYGDTPSFMGVYEAALYTVGNTLNGLELILEKKVEHFFNPVGGLHHARRDRAGGFCVFNDCAVAISKAINELGMERVAYVDIDAHHGDGVYYGFEDDPRVIIADIHEDGKYLYPGTGNSNEWGKDSARGTKLNIPLAPGSGDKEFFGAFDGVMEFLEHYDDIKFVFFQCGADGLSGDPLTHLEYTGRAHGYATTKLSDFARKICGGRLLAMGGGGYNPENVRDAWMSVVQELSRCA